MKITVSTTLDKKQEVLVLGLFEDDSKNYADLSKELAKELEIVRKAKEFTAAFGTSYSTRIHDLDYRHVLVLGLGKLAELDTEKIRKLMGKCVKATKSKKKKGFTTNIALLAGKVIEKELLGRAVAEGVLLANYSFIQYLSKERRDKNKSLVNVSIQWKGTQNGFGSGLKQGRSIAEAANFVRDLVNEPAGVANSHYLEKKAREVAAGSSRITVKVLGKQQMEKLGMGCLLGVNAGSKNPPKLIFLEYKNGGNEKPIAFVGKGITFDSGGYNLKPTKYIEMMHTDMGGSAAVLGAMKSAAALGVKKNIIGVMAVCENMVDSNAQHPGDIVKAYNGKTVQIGNTDAEGRLVLADALSYTQEKYKPQIMIDLATLTGACVVALGYYAAGCMGKDEKLVSSLKDAGMLAGDRVWPLPFFEEYQDWMDGSFSDLNNIAQKGKGYEAGSVTAGVFLSKFVDLEKTRWVHLDIAGTAHWIIDNDYLSKGATGSGVRMLSYWLLQGGK